MFFIKHQTKAFQLTGAASLFAMDGLVLPAGHVVAEDEEFIQIPVADIHEVMAILEKM